MPEIIREHQAPFEGLRTFASRQHLFAILDACDEPEVPGKVAEAGERAKCLYRGVDDPETLAIAPYLVHLQEADLDWLGDVMWQRNWGIFAIAKTDLKTLRRHFRKFLMVNLEGEGAVYFRYYDPRVLATFLPTCDADQLREFFGPIEALGVARQENEDSQEVQLFTRA